LHVVEPIPEAWNHAPVGPLEVDRALAAAPYLEAALVQQRVMKRAKQREVLEARLSALRPMLDVMRIDVAAVVTAGE
jgi:hypothetical protein